MILPFRFLVTSLLCSVAALPAEEKQAAIVLPAEFEAPSPPIPDAENGILLFLKEFKIPVGEEMQRYSDSLELLKAGKPVADPRFLEEFRQTHKLGRQWLKSPLRFPDSETTYPNIAPFLRLFEATEILARQSFWEGDRNAANRYLADALSWSKLLRNAQPTMLQGLMGQHGWRSSIALLLEDWQDHDDQRQRLDELLPVLQANRIEIEELVATAKAEARWWAKQGGTREFLKKPGQGNLIRVLLNDRFENHTLEELLSLPYDPEADFKRSFDETSGQIRELRQGIPALGWPGILKPAVDRSFEDYLELPNGLGDLLYEQTDPFDIAPLWIHSLCRQRQLDVCLIWLKRERNGLDVTGESFKAVQDPISGKPFDVDLKRRLIRCRGWDGKLGSPGPEELEPGFHEEQGDTILVVPCWKERK